MRESRICEFWPLTRCALPHNRDPGPTAGHLIVRTSWVYAAKGKNFLNMIIALSRERSELRIVGDQIGAPTPARVIARIVTTILEQCRTDMRARFANAGGVINVATSGETSWHGFATAIVDRLRARGDRLQIESIVPIRTQDYPRKGPQAAQFASRPDASQSGIWDRAPRLGRLASAGDLTKGLVHVRRRLRVRQRWQRATSVMRRLAPLLQ